MKIHYLVLPLAIIASLAAGGYAQPPQDATRFDDAPEMEMPPQQGTIIPCELCVILCPAQYAEHPELCPICHGAKEHFQPAQMMTKEMSDADAQELDIAIEEALLQTIYNATQRAVTPAALAKIRALYYDRLVHALIYDESDVERIKQRIIECDRRIAELNGQ